MFLVTASGLIMPKVLSMHLLLDYYKNDDRLYRLTTLKETDKKAKLH